MNTKLYPINFHSTFIFSSSCMSQQIEKICVFCGSRFGNDPAYSENAVILGKELVKNNIGLVYGGQCGV